MFQPLHFEAATLDDSAFKIGVDIGCYTENPDPDLLRPLVTSVTS